MEWISCKDKLPDASGSYFVTFIWGDIAICTDVIYFHLSDNNHHKWIWDKCNHREMTDSVRAWLPHEPYMGN